MKVNKFLVPVATLLCIVAVVAEFVPAAGVAAVLLIGSLAYDHIK